MIFNNNELISAAKEGDIIKITEISNNEANTNIQDHQGNTALHVAAMEGHLNVVKKLLCMKATIDTKNKDDLTPFELANNKNKSEIVSLLLNYQNFFGSTLLHCAIFDNNLNLINLLLKKGADVNIANCRINTPLHVAVMRGYSNVVKKLLNRGAKIYARNEKNLTPLELANEGSELENFILNDRDNLGNTLLHHAAFGNDPKLINLFLKKGIDVNVICYQNNTPLHVAAMNDRLDALKELLSNKTTNIDAKNDNDSTPLHISAKHGHLNVVKELIKGKADINAKNENLDTPLHVAAEHGHLNIVGELIKGGASISAENNDHITPFQLASSKNMSEVVDFFLNIENYCVYKLVSFGVENNKANLIDTEDSYDDVPLELMTSGVKNPFSLINSLLSWVKSSIGGLLGSRVELSKETSSAPSPISQVDAQMDVNGIIMLLDVQVRKVTGQKYISTVDQSISLLEAQGYALNIIEEFEKVVNQAALRSGISMHRLNIDFVGMQKEVTKKIMGGKFDEISGIVKSQIKKACPGGEAGCPGKLSSKKFGKFMVEFNSRLNVVLGLPMEQILHNGDGRLEVDGEKKQQVVSLEPQSYLSNASVQGHLTWDKVKLIS